MPRDEQIALLSPNRAPNNRAPSRSPNRKIRLRHGQDMLHLTNPIERQEQKKGSIFLPVMVTSTFVALIVVFFFSNASVGSQRHTKTVGVSSLDPSLDQDPFTSIPEQVQDRPGFFGYSNNSQRFRISYNYRSILIDKEPILLLGGSLHPVRHTPATWEAALDQAVLVGFNLVTIYVFWSAHQPFPDRPLDWRLPGSDFVCRHDADTPDCWTLSTAIVQAARRRLWVHLRIGPYVCAEYNYGGIPEWVALDKPAMALRRPNRLWIDVMEAFVTNVTQYVSSNRLWAHQGGNILMAQIENELQGEVDEETEYLMWVSPDGQLVDDPIPGARHADLQDYANWCGELVERLEPRVLWTMCQGLSAPNTIETCNGDDCSDWLDRGGSTHRVQKDFPAMWTEFEGGFQDWGEDADRPSDYFWGQTARQYAFRALRWIARGGTHLNYYMFGGGYNRDRMAAAGITNMYASDALLCSSGEPRHPKFDHAQKVHFLIQNYATLLLRAAQLALRERVQIRDGDGSWTVSPNDTLLFRYQNETNSLLFVENMSSQSVEARWNVSIEKTVTFQLSPWSVSVYDGIDKILDSSQIDPTAMAYNRINREIPFSDQKFVSVKMPDPCQNGVRDKHPVEQTRLVLQERIRSDYAWYSTEWYQETTMRMPILVVETQFSNAFLVWLDGRHVASNDTHIHGEGPVTLIFVLPSLTAGRHNRIALLSESLGYGNAIGVWGSGTSAKSKGITGNVYLYEDKKRNQSLVQGQDWCSCAGLSMCGSTRTRMIQTEIAFEQTIWHFFRPKLLQDERLFVRLQSGRGHLFLNDQDLGRAWNITRAPSGKYSQIYYLLPVDYLLPGNNELRFDNVMGGGVEHALLIASSTNTSEPPGMEDAIDFPGACL